MKTKIESDIDCVVTELITEVLCIVEFAEHGTTPDDEDRGPPPDDATHYMIDQFEERLRYALASRY